MTNMSGGIRNVVQQKIAQTLRNTSTARIYEVSSNLYVKCENPDNFTFSLPLKTKQYDIEKEAENIARNSRDVFPEIDITSESRSVINFKIPRDIFVKNILENNVKDVSAPSIVSNEQNIVVEFSSPNIAKPFHVGHLRSTIIGNYIANLHTFVNNKAKRINYLGDWGTQFGYIQLGADLLDISNETLKLNPIGESYKAYVHANNLAKADPEVAKRARQIFQSLEKGDEAVSQKWNVFRKYTIDELEQTYGRLGVRFDEYHGESMYGSREIGPIIEQMKKLKLLKIDDQERQVVVLNENRNVPIIKSDGSTLYLTRDIAAAIDRWEKYKFDFMYYVVDNAQTDHFTNLVTILERMGQPCAKRLCHVKFGKIRGMSTRKGTAVFLRDFLNEARDSMREKQTNSLTTKVSLDGNDKSSDSLGMSAVIIHDLKQKRQRDYEFNWNVALDIKGNTGVKLQYAHCRLVSLEENCGAALPTECDPSLLREPIVNDLITKIVQFDEIIILSYQTLEPCYLANYLFDLSHVVNKTLKELRVKGESHDVGSQRLLLYRVARNVLGKGMRLLGLQPLDKM